MVTVATLDQLAMATRLKRNSLRQTRGGSILTNAPSSSVLDSSVAVTSPLWRACQLVFVSHWNLATRTHAYNLFVSLQ